MLSDWEGREKTAALLPGLFEDSECRVTVTRFVKSHIYEVRTDSIYPDGDIIDLFLEIGSHGLIVKVTDMGETLRWLRTTMVSPNILPSQVDLIEAECYRFGARWDKGEIFLHVAPLVVPSAVKTLTTLCANVATKATPFPII